MVSNQHCFHTAFMSNTIGATLDLFLRGAFDNSTCTELASLSAHFGRRNHGALQISDHDIHLK